ncbi:TPA: small toxic inner membrane protein TimP [Citrobacter amalonaticus]
MDRTMTIRYVCIVLLVSGVLCLHADQSYPSNSVLVKTSDQGR